MCIAAARADAGELAQHAFERHEVRDPPRRDSTAKAWRLAQRASGFKLLPMRATCRVRSRSASTAAAVEARVRAIAWRSPKIGHRQAGGCRLRLPVGQLARRHAGVHSGGAPVTHRRTARKERGHARRSTRKSRRAAGCRGFEGAHSAPSPASMFNIEYAAPGIYMTGASLPVRRLRRCHLLRPL